VPSEYRKATGFEALIGFLYLKGDTERSEELIKAGVRFLDEKKQ
jgi:ribonuclease-3 family protein